MSPLSANLSRAVLFASVLFIVSTSVFASPVETTGASDSASSFKVLGRPQHDSQRKSLGSSAVRSSSDLMYSTSITLNGVAVEVMIDTGSSDLWTNVTIPQAKNMSAQIHLPYAIGTADGYAFSASLELGGYRIPDQAYVQVTNISDMDVNGIIGLGPRYNSLIHQALNNSVNNPPLDRIFQQNASTPNYLSILMTRMLDDQAGPDSLDQKGQMTIGKPIEGMEHISDQPKLPALTGKLDRAHWATILDEGAICGPDGQSISVKSRVNGSEGSPRLHAVFDTGYSYPQVPREVVDAFYGRVPGATYVPAGDVSPGHWRLPCTYELNVTFVMGGVKIPIAPIDMTRADPFADEGMCMATFQELDPSIPQKANYDMILGMVFFRNAYFLANYGDFVDGSPENVSDPYIQLLSVTDVKDAHNDFVTLRQRGDRSYKQPPLLTPGQGQTSPELNTTTSKA